MEGFVVFDYESQSVVTLLHPSHASPLCFNFCSSQVLNPNINSYDEARKELSQWLAEGKIQRKETIIRGGLAAAEQGLADLYKGINTGWSSPFVFVFGDIVYTNLSFLAMLTQS
jgi:hypothetical protein